jgi:antitoxin VapB
VGYGNFAAVKEDEGMKSGRFTERELLDGLDAKTAHADELAELLPQELTPLERLKGSVKNYERPLDSFWDKYFDSDERVSDDFMTDRGQSSKNLE